MNFALVVSKEKTLQRYFGAKPDDKTIIVTTEAEAFDHLGYVLFFATLLKRIGEIAAQSDATLLTKTDRMIEQTFQELPDIRKKMISERSTQEESFALLARLLWNMAQNEGTYPLHAHQGHN